MFRPYIAPSINSKNANNLKAYIAIWNQEYSSLQTFNTPLYTLPTTTITDKYITPYLEVSINARRCNSILININ